MSRAKTAKTANRSAFGFMYEAQKLARNRVRGEGQRSLDVLATVSSMAEEWFNSGKSAEALVDHILTLPPEKLTKSEFRLPGN
jgi:hypothetical protein